MDIKREKTKHPNQPTKIHNTTEKAVTYRLIREFQRVPITADNKQNFFVFWVVQWQGYETADGRIVTPEPQFEKRRIYVCKSGDIRTHKICGLSPEDLAWFARNYKEIMEALQQA